MAAQRGTLELLANEFGSALGALQDVLRVDSLATLFLELGLDDPPDLGGDAQFVQKLTAAADQCSALDTALEHLAEEAQADDLAGRLQAVAQVIEVIVKLFDDLDAVAVDLKRATAGDVNAATIAAFAEEMGGRLLEAAIVRYLETVYPIVERILAILTLVEVTPLPLPPASPPLQGTGDGSSVIADADQTVPLARRRLHLDRIAQLFQDPLTFLKTAYDWGDDSFDGKKLFVAVNSIFDINPLFDASLGPLLSTVDETGDASGILSLFTVSFAPTTDAHPPGVDGLLHVNVAPSTDLVIARFSENWRFSMGLTKEFGAGLEMRLLPPAQLAILPPEENLSGDVRLGFIGENPGQQTPFVIVGQTAGSRLEARRVEAAILANLKWDVGAGRAKADVGFEASAVEGRVVIDTSEGDSFLSFLTGGAKGDTAVTLSITWTPDKGFKIEGSTAVDLAIPAHAGIGPVELETIYLRSGFQPGGKIPVEVSAAIKGSLGPLTVTVDRIGLTAGVTFPSQDGNLGPVNLDIGFKPPNGVGLVLDAGGFNGGGFLYLDIAKGEYAGALELSFQGVVDVRAIGILNTKLPDGSPGFSLLVLISAEFAPIQLSFGFTLIGVGGLIGLNRTILFDPLRAGVKDGSLNSVLFPRDVVANAPRIVADLKRIFPPLDGRFLIGPMAKLGWGTPTFVSLELGLLLEIPRPGFAIAGVLRITLPAEEKPIIKIQVNFLGNVDFERRQLSFDASLYDSYVLFMPLTGDMAVRVYWGDDANFLLSVGGFHPSYRPPPAMALGRLDRLTIIISRPQPLIRAEVYFAVTSNTIQFGAKVELMAGASIFNVYGFLALDALINADTLQFVAVISGMLAVRSESSVLFAIRLELTLSGPSPWHAKGKGSFEIGYIFTITIAVHFDVTVGEALLIPLLPILVIDLLRNALNDDTAWRALPPYEHSAQVSLREHPPEGPLVLHPAGALGVAQKAVPLNLPLSRVGPRRVDGGNTFRITEVRIGTTLASVVPIREQFAPAQFTDMSDAEKLSRPSFEALEAGVQASGGDAPRSDFMRVIELTYEVIYIRKQRLRIFSTLSELLAGLFVMTGAAANSPLGRRRFKHSQVATPPVSVDVTGFGVATTEDMKLHRPDLLFHSEAEAAAARNNLVAADPKFSGKLQVLPHYELAA